jgi:hypothetical protein
MRNTVCAIAVFICAATTALTADKVSWSSTLQVYDHMVLLEQDNKILSKSPERFEAPYIRTLPQRVPE